MNGRARALALAIIALVYMPCACALAATVFVDVPTPPILATATAMPLYQSFLPYAAILPRATPTRIDLRTPTPRATATRYTGTRAPTATAYP